MSTDSFKRNRFYHLLQKFEKFNEVRELREKFNSPRKHRRDNFKASRSQRKENFKQLRLKKLETFSNVQKDDSLNDLCAQKVEEFNNLLALEDESNARQQDQPVRKQKRLSDLGPPIKKDNLHSSLNHNESNVRNHRESNVRNHNESNVRNHNESNVRTLEDSKGYRWYLDIKPGNVATSRCVCCKEVIYWCLFHLYTHESWYIPSMGNKVIKTKLRICAKYNCVSKIIGLNNNREDIRHSMKVIHAPSLVIPKDKEECLAKEGFILVSEY